MNLYEEIQKYIPNAINGNDFLLIENMQKKYTDEQILQLIKDSKVKNINYISKITPKKINKPEWVDKDIKKEVITKEEQDILLKEMKIFFNNEEEYNKYCKFQKDKLNNYYLQNK